MDLVYMCILLMELNGNLCDLFSGVQVNSTAQGPEVTYDPLKMEFLDDTNGYFKPGLPIHGKVRFLSPFKI